MAPDPLAGIIAYTGGQWATIFGVLIIGLAIKAAVAVWVYRSVRDAGRDPTWWTVAAVVVDIPTLIGWLLVRPTPRTRAKGRARGSSDPARGPATTRHGATHGAGAEGGSREAPRPMARIACPRCAHAFEIERANDGPTSVTCPRCGASGQV